MDKLPNAFCVKAIDSMLQAVPSWVFDILEQVTTKEVDMYVPSVIATENSSSEKTFTKMFDDRRKEIANRRIENERNAFLQNLQKEIDDNVFLLKIYKRIEEGETIVVTHKNSKKSMVQFVPLLSHEDSFRKWARNNNSGLNHMISYMSGSKTLERTSENKTASDICNYMATKFPNSFRETAIEHNFHPKIRRLSPVETVALATDTRLSDKTLFDKLGKHLKVLNSGSPLLCTKPEYDELARNAPVPKIEKGFIVRDEKKEHFTLAKFDLLEQLSRCMSREIELCQAHKPRNFNRFGSPMFGYRTTKHHQKGVFYMDGVDYGNNAIQFSGRLNFGSPFTRRMTDNADHETMDFRYGIVKCPKERHEIIAMMNRDVKKSVDTLRASQLVGIQNSSGKVHCILIDKRATGLEIRGNRVFVSLPRHGRVCKHSNILYLPDDIMVGGGNLKWFSIISHFQVLQVGDLCAQLLLQGRKGMSAHRCLKCHFTSREWKLQQCAGPKISRRDQRFSKNTAIGQSEHRYWPYNPSECIVPLLHCMLGTAKVQVFDNLVQYLLRLDAIPPEEKTKMDELWELKRKLTREEGILTDKIELLGLRKIVATAEKKVVYHELNKAKGRLRTARKSRLVGSDERVKIHEATVAELSDDILRISEDTYAVEYQVQEATNSVDETSLKVADLERDLQKLLNARAKIHGSLYSVLEEQMQKFNIYVQAYHGGSLTGGDIIALFKNADAIIDAIEPECQKAIEKRELEGTVLNLPTVADMKSYLSDHREMFALQNSVYANLRTLHPTRRELRNTKVSIDAMKEQWKKMGFSETPKAHLIFYHAADDQQRWGGLGDKTEDALERIHQTQKAHDCVTMRMRGGHGVELQRQAVIEWRESDPRVTDRIRLINHLSKRTFAEDRETGRSNQKKRTRVLERRDRFKQACTNVSFDVDGEGSDAG